MNEEHKLAPCWNEVELEFRIRTSRRNPYREVDAWVDFIHDSGTWLRRPAFWDGGDLWKVRFASTRSDGHWRWKAFAAGEAEILGQSGGSLEAVANPHRGHRFHERGFWRMGPSGRNLMHADGSSDVLVADTAWALPWRATAEQVREYAARRRSQGFNAVLMMTVQPDRFAEGPEDRTKDHGFGRAFDDLPSGHLNEIRVDYFRLLDELMAILVAHEIVPVYQPVFHGYGWKGLGVAGKVVPPDEYARFCRYLVARYGARPAVWLVGADGSGDAPGVLAGGEEVERWDGYRQPTGLHYGPNARGDAHQEAGWLDFQWCQTGHDGQHVPERVANLWRNQPPKAVANGEPTYEHIGRRGLASGWWQGHEAWCNLMAGGTMGVVYGAGSLWQWRLHADEPGHQVFCRAEGAGWREALDFEGANYVGVVGKILRNLPIEGMAPHWELAIARGILAIPGKLVLVYCPDGIGFGHIDHRNVPPDYIVYNLRNGEVISSGHLKEGQRVEFDSSGIPALVVFMAR